MEIRQRDGLAFPNAKEEASPGAAQAESRGHGIRLAARQLVKAAGGSPEPVLTNALRAMRQPSGQPRDGGDAMARAMFYL